MIAEDPAVQGWQAATESTMSTSSTARRLEAELDQARKDFNAVLLERDALADELTTARGQIVDLLYTLDAFQIESGADSNAAHQAGIEAVRQLHRDRDEARQRLSQALSACDELGKTHALAILHNNRLQRENKRLRGVLTAETFGGSQ